jgi:hypothetical protein
MIVLGDFLKLFSLNPILNDMNSSLFDDFIGGTKSTNLYCPRKLVVNLIILDDFLKLFSFKSIQNDAKNSIFNVFSMILGV